MNASAALKKKSVILGLVLCLAASSACTRVRLAQRIEQLKISYDRGNFSRVLGYAQEGQAPENNNPYDPPGNFTVGEIRALLLKEAGSGEYDYRHLFQPSLAARISVERQDYLRQLALIELRALIHQYFSTHAPPYREASGHLFIKRARFLSEGLGQLGFARAWERAELWASQGDLAVLDGQYEVAQVAYSLIFGDFKELPEGIVGQYAKRYMLSFERAVSTRTVSKDPTQEEAFRQEFAANLKKVADSIPNHPVGMYAQARLLAASQKPLLAFVAALASWRRTDDPELRNRLDQFVELQLEDYWPVMKNDASFKKLILDQWNANKRSTSPR